MTEFVDWFKSVPKFTRYWFALTVGLSFLARFDWIVFHLLPHHRLILWPASQIITSLEIWRPFTSVLYYPLNPNTAFHFMINCYFLYSYSTRLETIHFLSSPADYFFLLMFNFVCCVLIGIVASFQLLMDPMVMSVLYIWCQLNKDAVVNFWFGTRFKAMYLPWVLLLLSLIMSGAAYSLAGIIVGHLYFFLKFQYPTELGGAEYLITPNFLKRYFPDVRGGVHGFGVAPVNQRNVQQAADNRGWGRGHVLGGN